ncbi:MAG TPA: PaaI family thioesterase [Dehalococcoidia bacterium]|nr:PaaI family thioesterase [Dehalococcoidia bacterium]
MAKEVPADTTGFNPFGDLIGLQFVKCEGGQSRCTLEVEQRLLNPHGAVHGGVLYSMADTGMGGAMYTVMEKEELCATIEIKITYFKAVRSGTLVCDTRIISRGRRVAALESEITSDGRLVAKASGTFSVFRAKEG